jgi:CheY-like chemotaxis protein
MGLVLVVEDDTSTMFVICSLVQRMGHIPIRARNGRVAWEILQDNHDGIDLVITDLMMPEMDGHELIVKIREDIKTAKKPIIVQSAYLGVKGTRELMEQGADAVIPKPIDGQYLMDHIARHIALATPEKSKSPNISNQRLA